MKTPEEIKKGLECCSTTNGSDFCKKCPYEANGCGTICIPAVTADAFAYIQQLEAKVWEVFETITSTYYGKQYYFLQDDGTVYSRYSGESMTFEQAMDEFCRRATDE